MPPVETNTPPIENPKRDFSALVTGSPGTGKTWLSLTAPRPLHIFDIDEKVDMTVSSGMIDMKDVTYTQYKLPVRGLKGITTLKYDPEHPKKEFRGEQKPQLYLKHIEDINRLYEEYEKTKTFPWKTIVIDTGSRLGLHLEACVLHMQGHTHMTQGDWRSYKDNWIEYLTGLFLLPCNIIMNSHDITYTDEITKELKVRPAISGAIGELLGGFFQESYYLVPKNVNNQMTVNVLTHADRKYSLTSQYTKLYEVPADFKRILSGEFKTVEKK